MYFNSVTDPRYRGCVLVYIKKNNIYLVFYKINTLHTLKTTFLYFFLCNWKKNMEFFSHQNGTHIYILPTILWILTNQLFALIVITNTKSNWNVKLYDKCCSLLQIELKPSHCFNVADEPMNQEVRTELKIKESNHDWMMFDIFSFNFSVSFVEYVHLSCIL